MPALTPLAAVALGLLTARPMHPYEMYQTMLHRREDRLVKVRPGSLYHTVERLARDGHAAVRGTDREGNRPERTTYEITDAGRAALSDRLVENLSTPAEEYPEFPLALSGAGNLASGQFADLLRARLPYLREHRDAIVEGGRAARAKDVAERYLLDISYQRAMLDAEITWIEDLLRQVESGRLAW